MLRKISTKCKIPLKKKTRKYEEEHEQTKVCVYLAKHGLYYFCIPNGGKRGMFEAMRLKRTGVMAGIPDLMIPMARGKWHGLFLEMKKEKGGTVSESQKYWIEILRAQDYKVEVCHGANHAIDEIAHYFSL
jgi:hypothetical protein